MPHRDFSLALPAPLVQCPQPSSLTQKASLNCSWGIILRRLPRQSSLSCTGWPDGGPGARSTVPVLAGLAQAPLPGRRRLQHSEGSHEPGGAAEGRKRLNLFCLGLESAAK